MSLVLPLDPLPCYFDALLLLGSGLSSSSLPTQPTYTSSALSASGLRKVRIRSVICNTTVFLFDQQLCRQLNGMVIELSSAL